MAVVHGTLNDDTIDAADGVTNSKDYIFGLGGDDTLFGLGGTDYFEGGLGADHLDGGNGDYDIAAYIDSDEAVFVSLLQGLGFGGTAEGDTLVRIERLMGSAFNDALIGDGGPNLLEGWLGHDTLKGGGGADFLSGHEGDDILHGGAGGDELKGGPDTDTAAYDESNGGVHVSLQGNAGNHWDAEGDTYDSIENVTGSDYDDRLVGNDDANVLTGLMGEDTLKGGGGSDVLWGGAGTDGLFGGNGVDTLYGGAHADTFFWVATSETGLPPGTADVIADFNRAQGDRIDLSGIDANVYAIGNQAFTFIGTGAFSGTPGELRYYHSGGHTFIEMQTGTSVDVEGVIRLNGIHAPEASWFVL